MKRQLHIVIERIARAMCACQNDCNPQDGYCTAHWIDFAPAARAAYRELLLIDYERTLPPIMPVHEPEVLHRIDPIKFPQVEARHLNIVC